MRREGNVAWFEQAQGSQKNLLGRRLGHNIFEQLFQTMAFTPIVDLAGKPHHS